MLSIDKAITVLCSKYSIEHKVSVDEMKLHKLLYFSQKESYAVFEKPLFKEEFYGWMYGPVLKEVRNLYKNSEITKFEIEDYTLGCSENDLQILETVYKKYADWDSWSLSRLSHGENSWKKSRTGLKSNQPGNEKIAKVDIMRDGLRLKERRERLARRANEDF